MFLKKQPPAENSPGRGTIIRAPVRLRLPWMGAEAGRSAQKLRKKLDFQIFNYYRNLSAKKHLTAPSTNLIHCGEHTLP